MQHLQTSDVAFSPIPTRSNLEGAGTSEAFHLHIQEPQRYPVETRYSIIPVSGEAEGLYILLEVFFFTRYKFTGDSDDYNGKTKIKLLLNWDILSRSYAQLSCVLQNDPQKMVSGATQPLKVITPSCVAMANT